MALHIFSLPQQATEYSLGWSATARNPRYDGRFINQPAKRATAIDATLMMMKARTTKNCRPHSRA